MHSVDFNCDMGESFGAWRMGDDAAVMPWISSASIACGMHAGDPSTMQATVALARSHGVAIGAHVALPDLQGFGRRAMAITPAELHALALYQIGALAAFAHAAGTRLRHVKAHGALYHQVHADAALATALADAVAQFDTRLAIIAMAGGALATATVQRGLPLRREAFADRGYAADGTLLPRGQPGAVLDAAAAAAQAVRLAQGGTVTCDTLCVHGDGANAAGVAAAVHHALCAAGIAVAAPA